MGYVRADQDVFRAIADPTRRRMLDLLLASERSVSELGASFDISQPAVSQHLRVLELAGLVRARRVGRTRLYRLEPGPLEEVADWALHYARMWPRRMRALRTYLDRTVKGR